MIIELPDFNLNCAYDSPPPISAGDNVNGALQAFFCTNMITYPTIHTYQYSPHEIKTYTLRLYFPADYCITIHGTSYPLISHYFTSIIENKPVFAKTLKEQFPEEFL